MSSGKSSSTSTTEMPGWMQPYAQSYLSQANTVAQKPYQAYNGQTVAGLDPRTTQGIDMTAQLAQGTQAGNAGTQTLTDTLQGKYLGAGSNPYLSGQIDAAQQETVRNYNTAVKPAMESAMVGSGSFGNSGLQQMQQGQQSDLQRSLGNISTQMRGNAYATERGLQNSALGMAPTYNNMQFGNAQALMQAGQLQQGNQQAQLSDAYQRWQEAQGYDANRLGVLGNALGNLRGGGTTTQTGTGGPSTASQLGSTALAAYLMYAGASDRRLKTDIKRVGKTDEGFGVYTYRYKIGGPLQMGVMAQEVKDKRPDLVSPLPGAEKFDRVNYGLLGA